MRANPMIELPTRLVVRRVAPVKRALLIAAVSLGGLWALNLAYERGRFNAGYDRSAAAKQRSEFNERIATLEKTNAGLNARVAELDTLGVGRVQERAEYARTIGDLQAQVARQTQEIEFYRSVLSQSAASHGEGLALQQVRITPGTAAGHFVVHLTLLELTRPEADTKGTLQLSVQGTAAGKSATLDHASLTDGKTHEQAFSFRYFKNLDEEITLAQGFHPERLTVEAHPHSRNAERSVPAGDGDPAGPLVQSFPWRVDGP